MAASQSQRKDEQQLVLLAFYAFEFWKCAGIGLPTPAHNKKEKDFWWNDFVERRAKAMGIPVGFRKFWKG